MTKGNCLFYRHIFSAVMVLILILGVHPAAQAAPYFKGKAITFIVSYSPGGGTDMFARLVAKHLTRFIPGKPRSVVRNIPGGGGVIGANFAYAAKPNGLTAFATSGGNVMSGLLRPKGVVYKMEEMHPIYSTPIGIVYFSRPNLITNARDIMSTKGLIWGHIGPTTGVASGFVWSKALLGFKVEKMVWGYGGSSAANMAFLSGELNFSGQATTGYNASVKQYVERGEIVPLFQCGLLDEDGNVVREPAAPDVPTAAELYEQIHGKKPSGMVFKAYKVVVGSRTYGKAILFPAKTPPKVMAILRKAANEMVKDRQFLKEAERQNPNAPHFYGESLVRSYAPGISAPREVLEYMKQYLKKEYNVVFD